MTHGFGERPSPTRKRLRSSRGGEADQSLAGARHRAGRHRLLARHLARRLDQQLGLVRDLVSARARRDPATVLPTVVATPTARDLATAPIHQRSRCGEPKYVSESEPAWVIGLDALGPRPMDRPSSAGAKPQSRVSRLASRAHASNNRIQAINQALSEVTGYCTLCLLPSSTNLGRREPREVSETCDESWLWLSAAPC